MERQPVIVEPSGDMNMCERLPFKAILFKCAWEAAAGLLDIFF